MEMQRKLIEFVNSNNNNNNNLYHFSVSYFSFPCLNNYYGPIFSVVCIAMKSAYLLRHVLLRVYLSVRPSFRMYQRGFHLTDFHAILYWGYP
jgi:hypothetical protein